MERYLSDFINTQSSRRREKIYDLLEEVRVSRESVDALYSRLSSSVAGLSPLQISKEEPNTRIESSKTLENIRQSSLKLRELYGVSNLVSLLLNSHISILDEEISSLENDIYEAEKSIRNYAFLLADGRAFDYAFLEPFNDEIARDRLQPSPDRAPTFFGAAEEAKVKLDEGVLVLPENSSKSYALSARIIKSNCSGKVTDSNDISRSVKGDAEGWTARIDSPRPISTSIRGGADVGAQFEIEFALENPTAISQVSLSPFSGIPVDVLSIRIYNDEDKFEEVLSNKVELSRKKSFRFPLQSVSRFVVLINQNTYTRKTHKNEEGAYLGRIAHLARFEKRQDSFSFAGQSVKDVVDSRSENTRKITRKVLSNIEPTILSGGAAFAPSESLKPFIDRVTQGLYRDWKDPRSDIAPIARQVIIQAVKSSRGAFRASQRVGDIARLLGADRDTSDQYTMKKLAEVPTATETADANGITSRARSVIDQGIENARMHIQGSAPSFTLYDGYLYSVGIKTASAENTSPLYRGVYVSKPFTSPGDVGQVRLKSLHQNYESKDITLHSKKLTSVEYSVSSHPSPTEERHWVPILPVQEKQVEAERLVFDKSGRAILRFPAELGGRLAVYKNGRKTGFNPSSDVPGVITSVRVPANSITRGDIYTVDYVPSGDRTTVNFDEFTDFSKIPLTTAFDNTGTGEGFNGTSERNTVTLQKLPYVDSAKALEADQVNDYSPITVVLQDGTLAVNMTDYRSGTTPSLISDVEEITYVQSGQKLLFNKPITSPFRVYYNYLENNVRFRVVLRCNTKDFVSPEVDYVQVKAKIRKSNQSQ